MLIRFLAVMGAFAASVMVAPAQAAVTYTWNTASGGSVLNSSSMQFSSTQDSNEKIKVTAYQISTLSAGSAFSTAGLVQYGGGLGITSTNETTTSPNHSMDNQTGGTNGIYGRYELMLVEFDSATVKNMGFQIGWSSNDSDVQVWVGNAAAGLNLAGSNAACGGSCDFTELSSLGFSSVQTFTNVALNTTQTVGGGLSGRYLLIGPRLISDDGSKDYVKLSLLSGTDTAVPEPSSLAIMAVAAAGAGFLRRKRKSA